MSVNNQRIAEGSWFVNELESSYEVDNCADCCCLLQKRLIKCLEMRDMSEKLKPTKVMAVL